jgi:tartrate dehydratase alpha subunit/fumarate hydratase class I-like protein
MKISQLRQLIREAVRRVVKEATSDTILYKVHFKPEYSREDDPKNTPIDPVFVQMRTGERTKLNNYAAIDKIGGHGNKTPDMLLAKDRLDTKEMSFNDLFRLIKTLHRVKIYR